MSMLPYDIDYKQRLEAAKILHEAFIELVEQIKKKENPTLVFPKRTLSNTIYDEERKLLLLGHETQKRRFLDVNEARKFMQTLLMAKIIYDSLINNEYPTIRDLYYRGKHSIIYYDHKGKRREENTWDEQKESDAIIRDIEVITGLLREDMLILSKEKGKLVGKIKLKSGGDIIDASKMGHGAYALEPTPDLIEIIEVDANFVLVVEKDAVFQQLHRYRFWEKYKALLITSAGQPDRATRRFVKRLNEECKLPVYILTDSIPADEVVVVRDTRTGRVQIGPIEKLIGSYFTGKDKERVFIDLEAPAMNTKTGKIEWRKIGYAYRHKIKDKIISIKTKGRGTIRVTGAHSLFVFKDGRIEVIPAREVKKGDYIVVASKLPPLSISKDLPVINVIKLLKGYAETAEYSQRFSLYRTVRVKKGNDFMYLNSVHENEPGGEVVTLSRSKNVIPAEISLDEDLAWLFGLFTAEGSKCKDRCLRFNLGPSEEELAKKIVKIMKEKFNLVPKVKRSKREITITISSKILYIVFKVLGLLGTSRTKKVPEIILNSPPRIVLAYIKGLIDGDGYVDEYGNIVYSTRSTELAKQVFNLLLSLGVSSSLTVNGSDYIIRIGKSSLRTPSEVYRYLTDKVQANTITSKPTYGVPMTKELRRMLIKFANEGKISYSSASKTVTKYKLQKPLKLVKELPEDYDKFVNGDITVVRVLDVKEEEYNGYVYDFMVPKSNSFIGGFGVLYHNSDPYGWYIYSVFKVGSVTLSYESDKLATPKARFLGVSMTDIFGEHDRKGRLIKQPYLSSKERKNFIIKATPRDVKRAKELLNYKWFQTKQWEKEILTFINKKVKLEIEALASKSIKFLADKYIPEKIENGWID